MIDSTLSHQKITPHNHNLIIISRRLSYNDNDLDGDDDVDYDEDMRMMMMIKEMIMTMALMVVITTYPDTHRPPDLIIIFSRF